MAFFPEMEYEIINNKIIRLTDPIPWEKVTIMTAFYLLWALSEANSHKTLMLFFFNLVSQPYFMSLSSCLHSAFISVGFRSNASFCHGASLISLIRIDLFFYFPFGSLSSSIFSIFVLV